MESLQIAHALRDLVEGCTKQLLTISDEAASRRLASGNWSRKQILGHLIDSAANNHQRFIRLQIEAELRFPGYDQDEWVARNEYASRAWAELVALWSAYNRHLAHVLEHLAPEALGHIWDRDNDRCTLEFIAAHYLDHLRHHLTQILED